MKKIILFLLFIGFAFPVFAADWVELAPKLYMDRNIYTGTDNLGNKYPLILSKKLNDGSDGFKSGERGKRIWYFTFSTLIDCPNKQIKEKEKIEYGLNNEVLFKVDNSHRRFRPVIPNTLSEYCYNYVCSGKK